MAIEHADQTVAEGYAAAAEDLRRSRSGQLNTVPTAPPLLDYASAGLKIDLAKHHLDESLPNGQLDRSVAAFKLLRAGVEELAVWLRQQGATV